MVFLVGGLRDAVLLANAEAGRKFYKLAYANLFRAKVVIPEYLRTALRSLYSRSDIEPAVEEVGDLISALTRAYPDHRIMLVTHSAGA